MITNKTDSDITVISDTNQEVDLAAGQSAALDGTTFDVANDAGQSASFNATSDDMVIDATLFE